VLRLHVVSGGDDRPYMAAALNGMAKSLLAQKKYDEANEYFQKGLVMRRRMFTGPSGETAYSLLDFGDGLMQQQRFSDAEPLLREAVSMLKAAVPDDVVRIAEVQCTLGDCLTSEGTFEEAEATLLAANRALFEGGGSGPGAARPDVRERSLTRLVNLYERWSGQPGGEGKAGAAQQWRDALAEFKGP